MTNIDPTSSSESFPHSGDTPWSVEDVAAAQAEAALIDSGGASREAASYDAERYPPAAAKMTVPLTMQYGKPLVRPVRLEQLRAIRQ